MYWPVLKTIGVSLIALYVVEVIISQYFAFAREMIETALPSAWTESDRQGLTIFTSGIEAVFDLIWNVFWIARITSAANSLQADQIPLSFFETTAAHVNQVLIESIRSVAAILWRIPLFIIPALLEYIRLTLVPFVVILSPSYHQGKLDALQGSRILAKGRLLALCAIATLGIVGQVSFDPSFSMMRSEETIQEGPVDETAIPPAIDSNSSEATSPESDPLNAKNFEFVFFVVMYFLFSYGLTLFMFCFAKQLVTDSSHQQADTPVAS